MSVKQVGFVVLVLYAVATIVALVIKVRGIGLTEGLSVCAVPLRRGAKAAPSSGSTP